MEEVARLSGNPIARGGSGLATPGGGPATPSTAGGGADPSSPGGGGGGDAALLLSASAVISSRLVTYRSLEELVEQNKWVGVGVVVGSREDMSCGGWSASL